MSQSETLESVGKWADETFPGNDPKHPRRALRVLEEVLELCVVSGASRRDIVEIVQKYLLKELPLTEHNLEDGANNIKAPNPTKVPAELADVQITIYALAYGAGIDLEYWVNKKMDVNRNRRWQPNGDGTGYHIKEFKGE